MPTASWNLKTVLAAAIIPIVLTSGCLSSSPMDSTATSNPQDLSSLYDATFVLSGWRAISKFSQVKPNNYTGVYVDAKGQQWNFKVELSSSESDAYGRYFELMKNGSDEGYVRTDESKIALGAEQTVFGRIDEKWYGYKTSYVANPTFYALFFGFDAGIESWVVVAAASGAIETRPVNA